MAEQIIINLNAQDIIDAHLLAYNHGNIANGETAYGWGNHALAGYELQANKGIAGGYASLDASTGKVPISQLPDAVIGGVQYQGIWNANTNSPDLSDLELQVKGHFYIVSEAGTQFGIDWAVGDWAIFNVDETNPTKVDNTDSVTSVNGQIGAVILTTAHIAEASNLYYTDARVKAYSDLNYESIWGHGNYIDQAVKTTSNPSFNTLTISTLAAGTADYDKFIVSDSGLLKYRTGVEVLNDIGAQASNTNLTSLAALSYASTSFVKMTGVNTFSLDTNTYLTAETDTLATVTTRGASTSIASTFSTSITTPLIIGGASAGSKITYKSTTEAGTLSGIAHQWLGGTDGATVITTMLNDGKVGINTTSPSYPLDVQGNININEGSAYLYNGSTALKLAKGTDIYYANTFVGVNAGNTTAKRQSAIGYYAGYQNTGDYQLAIGYQAGYLNTGDYQSTIGYYAGYKNIGDYQSTIGYLAGYLNTGDYQSAIGYYAGHLNTGLGQSAIGYLAGYKNIGYGQSAIGYYAGRENTGDYQLAIGYYAGYQNTGDYVSGFGYEATRNNTANNVVGIGYQAGKDNIVANQFIVKQANVNAVPLIQGDFNSGNIGIGITSPTAALHIKAGTAAAGTAPLKFTAGVALTTPEAGAMEFHDDRFYITNISLRKAISRANDVVTETITIENTTTESTIYTAIVPANSLKIGNYICLQMCGNVTNASTADDITLRLKIGSTTLETFKPAIGNVTNANWCVKSCLTVRSIGATGKLSFHGEICIDDDEECLSIEEITVDTTSAENITLTVEWDNAKVGNVFEIFQGITEWKN